MKRIIDLSHHDMPLMIKNNYETRTHAKVVNNIKRLNYKSSSNRNVM